MTDENERLRNVTRWRARPNRTARLGDTIRQLMDNQVSPQQARFGPVAELWGQLLPAELQRHCKIVALQGGQLKVQVDSPSYANELRWCCSELLEQIQQQCPRAKIKGIKFIVGEPIRN